MSVIYRPSRPDELEAIDRLVVSSINDLTQRHGFGPMAAPSPPRFAQFSLGDDPRGLWTAEEHELPVGFSFAWACGDFWFLAQLFVQPGLQSHGTGQALLTKALDHAELLGAGRRALITFAFNTVSQALYLRHGFTPRFPIYSMAGACRALPGARGLGLETVLLDGSDADISRLAEVDRRALGFSREKHHRLLCEEPGVRAFGVSAAGRFVGYFYISGQGHVGPLAVISADLLENAFEAALSLCGGAGETVSCFLPGANAGLVRCAMRRGLRLRFPMLLMSIDDQVQWPCYLPRNPGFM